MGILLITILSLLLIPRPALAFGPLAHIDFAKQTLADSLVIAPALLQLLRRYADDFYYGTLAADIIVGKNRAAAHEHSHGWPVARSLLTSARNEGPAREVFMMGYLHHLGADLVAHNYVIPGLLVAHYRMKSAGHLYWEARIDQRLLAMDPELRDIWNTVSARSFRLHDAFLQKNLVPTIFSNRISSALYQHNLTLQRTAPWRAALARMDQSSRRILDKDELLKWRKLAIYTGERTMNQPFSSRLDRLDPTGHSALHVAGELRRHLRTEMGRRNPPPIHLLEEALIRVKTVSLDIFEYDEEL